ncbi:MAG: LysR family transcriptional regulator [Microbacterium sp.]
MPITLPQLRAFVAVVDHRGFAAAADELGVTQSAVSHTVSALEASLGAPVVVRRPSLEVTALGRDILPHARSALASADALLHAARQTQEQSGTIRLGVTSTVCFGLLPALMTTWRTAHPAIIVRVFEGDDPELVTWLEDGTVDAAILIDPAADYPNGVLVGTDAYCAVVREDHPLAAEANITADALLDDPVLVSAGGCGPDIIDLLRSHDPGFTPAQRVYDSAALLNLVAADLGVTVFPSIGRGMLAPGTRMIALDPAIERRMVFTGPAGRAWHPLVEPLRSPLTRRAAH